MALTGAQRQRRYRERLVKEKRDAGFVPKEVWVKPSWWPQVKRLIDRLGRREA